MPLSHMAIVLATASGFFLPLAARYTSLGHQPLSRRRRFAAISLEIRIREANGIHDFARNFLA